MKTYLIVTMMCIAGNTLLTAQNRQTTNQKNYTTEGKEAFIKNRDYLSANPLSPGDIQYGDSLKGFDEEKTRLYALSNNVYGEEYVNYLKLQKRLYVNYKYKVGEAYNQVSNAKSGKKGSSNTVLGAPCVNEDFEATTPSQYNTGTAVNGWSVSTGFNSCNVNTQEGMPTAWSSGSPEFWVVQTPLLNLPYIGNLGASPLGGTNIVQLQDQSANGRATRLSQTFPVTQANTAFQFAYAGAYQDGTHDCCNQPFLKIRMYDCNGAPLGCSSLSLNPGGQGCVGAAGYTVTNGVSWTNWQVKFIDLTPYLGSCVTIEIINSDCAPTGHWASTYFDAKCGGQIIGSVIPSGTVNPGSGPVSFCSGANQAMIAAPFGYTGYQWYGPGAGPSNPGPMIAAPNGTNQILILNPSPQQGAIYTVSMTSQSGCMFVSSNTLVFTSVNIAAISTESSCPMGSSGSATVFGNGSGTGYNYTWTASNNAVVSTASVATNLAPGVYSIMITGAGAAGCGTAVSTATIFPGTTTVKHVAKPFCGSQAYLQTQGGSGFQWYSPNGLITGTVGALPHHTVSSPPPSNGAIYIVTYTTTQGCKDSIRFTLQQQAAGFVTAPGHEIKLICPSATNGSAAVHISPAVNAPGGFNSYSVFATGNTPAYSSAINPSSSNTYTVGGLAKGTYSVIAFDGSCLYGTSFSVNDLIWNFAVTPGTRSLCPGEFTTAVISSTTNVPTGYLYQWSPTSWMNGSTGNFPTALIIPTIAMGTNSTQVITVVVTPTVANCPQTRTLAITAVNPPIPQIEPIKPLCNTFAPYQVTLTPMGGTVTNALATPTVINQSGVLMPAAGLIGANTFTYAISVYTCVAKNTATYEVSKFYPSTLTSSVPPLCVTNAPFNLMSIVQNTINGTWSGPGVNPNGTYFDPSTLGTSQYVIAYTTLSSPNPKTCSVTSVLSVNVTSLTTPVIFQKQPFCNNEVAFTMTAQPSGGGWSGPNITPSGIVTPTNISTPGISSVVYTVADGPCINKGMTSFKVLKYNSAVISGTINELCSKGSPFNLMSIVSNTNGTWSGAGVQQNTIDPQYLSTNYYTLTYFNQSSPDPGYCDETKQIVVSVLNPPTPSIVPMNPICSAASPVQLTVTPATGQWVTTTYLNSGGVFNPPLSTTGNNVVKYVIGTPACKSESIRFINVEAFLPATIIPAKLPDLCNTSAGISLVPFTLTNLGTWSGPGISGTNFNPGVAGKGDFVLTHTTASLPTGVCTDQSTVAISVHSLGIPAIANVDRICNNSVPIQLVPTPVGGMFSGLNTGAVNKQGLFVPASANIGNNIISYSISAGPCMAYAQATLVVEKFVSADFDHYPEVFCSTSDPVNMNSYVQNPGGIWIGKGIVAGGSIFDPKLADPGDNNEITYITSSETKTLCPHTSTIRLIVTHLPAIQAVAEYAQQCAPVNVRFNIPNNNAGEREWIMGDGSVPQKGKDIEHIYTTPGSYTVVLNYHYKGCAAQVVLDKPIEVFEVPEANFTAPEEILISDPQIQMINLSTSIGNNKYSWFVTGGVGSKEGEVNPKFTLPKIGKYHITLVAENEHACKDELTRTVEVKNVFNIYIPTSFTPNEDGLNDIFIPVFTEFGLDTRQYDLEIFDRWGHSLFHSKDPAKGWDGSIKNSRETAQLGVYIYKIRYRDMEGGSYEKMGQVSVLDK